MTPKLLCTSVWILPMLFAFTLSVSATAPSDTPSDRVSYYRDIRPIFQAHCHGCHQPAKAKSKYVMTQFDRLLAGGSSGDPAVVANQPDTSLLVELITPIDGKAEMPDQGNPLSHAEIDLIRRWIIDGAHDDTPALAKQVWSAQNPPKYDSPPIVTSLAFSADGRLLAVSGFHEILIHDLEQSTLAARLVGLSARIESVCFSPDGKKLAVTGGLPARMGEVQIWDTESWKLTLSVPVTFDTIYGASWSPDSKLVAFGCGDNTLRAIDATTGDQVLFSRASLDWTLDTVFSVDGSHVISVGRDMTAKLTEVKTQRFVDNITSITPGALKGGLAAVDRHPTRDEVVVGGADGTPQIYRVHREVKRVIGDNSNLLRLFPTMPGRIFDLGYRADGKRIAAGSSHDGRGHVHIYRSDFDSTLPKGLKGILQKVSTARSAAERKRIEEFHRRDIGLVASATFKAPIYALCWHPNQQQLAVAGADGLIRVLNAEDASVNRVLMSAPLPDDRSEEFIAIVVDPPEVSIREKYGYQQLIVTGWLPTGVAIDLTTRATYECLEEEIASVDQGMVRPLADGTSRLRVSHQGHSVEVPMSISGRATEYHPSFVRDVSPVINKMGCSSGSCHGSKDGKNGFKLSLRGYDPQFDVRAFSDDHAGRRVNFASAADSLMLLKATGSVPHEGGQRTKVGTDYYEIVRQWIADGCPLDPASPRVVRLELSPKNPIVHEIGAMQQLRVIAIYDDDSERDVTAEAFVTSGNIEIASSTPSGLVTTLRRGEAALLARFEGAYAATTLTVMGDRAGFTWQDPPVHNRIDELVASKWKRLKILPSDLCNDADFLRRVTLDLTGLPPTVETVRAFLADERDTRTKRDELITGLVGSEEYIVYWGNRWADLLQVNSKFLGREGAESFRRWIHEQIEENTPYDEFVHEILTATGSTYDTPPASYFKILRTPAETMENTTQLFLATRFNCNKCHDHPFERWTQDQYYQMAAFFAQVHLAADPRSGKRRVGGTAVEGSKSLHEFISDKKSGDVTHERTAQIVPPTFPYHVNFEAPAGQTRRERLAAWITSPDNQYFARSYVNRVWGYLTGYGLIDPLDDIRAGNPPTNPELLDWLTEQFISSDFDVRALITTICESRTYQLSIVSNRWNEEDRVNYARATPRRLSAEVLYDSIHRALGAKTRIPGVPEGTRAAALPDVGIRLQDGFLGTLGRPARESACECERSNELGLGSVMALATGPTVDRAISDTKNAIAQLLEETPEDSTLIEELYLRILNRPAEPSEVDSLVELLKGIDHDHAALRAEYDAYQEEERLARERRESERKRDIDEAKSEVAAYEKEIAPREAELDLQQQQAIAKAEVEQRAYSKTLPEKLLEWEQAQSTSTRWVVVAPQDLKASNGATLTLENDGSIFASGKNGKGVYTFTAEPGLEEVTAVKFELISDDRLPKKGPGRAADGNFVLTEFLLTRSSKIDREAKAESKVTLHNAKSDFSQNGYKVQSAIDGKIDNTGWAVSPRFGVNHVATFEMKKPAIGLDSVLSFTLHFNYGNDFSFGRFRVWVTTSKTPVDFGLPPQVSAILEVSKEDRSEDQRSRLLSYFSDLDPGLQKHKKKVSNAKKKRALDPRLKQLRERLTRVEQPLPTDPRLKELERAIRLSEQQLESRRLTAIQDVAWALINNPAFLFNR